MSKSPLNRLGVGIDIGKDKSAIFFGTLSTDGTFKCHGSKAVAMTTSGIKKAVIWIKQRREKIDPDDCLPFQIVMESTSRYHERLLFALHEAELHVSLPQSRRLKNYLASMEWNSKNDPLDAKGLAHYACHRKTRRWAPFSPHILELRELLRARKSLINKKVRLGNQLHALDYAQHKNGEIKRSYGRLSRQIDREIVKLEKVIRELYQQDDKLKAKIQPIIKNVSGLALITVLTIAAETNGFATIKSRRQLTRYAGYDSVENQSGKFRGKTRMSKRGNKHIRCTMYMAALSHIRWGQGDIIAAYNRSQVKKPGVYKHGNVVVQHKLLLLIFTLWKNETIYDPHYGSKWNQPQANSSSIAKKSTSETSPEVRGIAPSEEGLPIHSAKIDFPSENLVS